MWTRGLLVAVLLTVVGGARDALAAPIVFTFSGVGSGSVGDTAFSDAAFTITAYGDTDNRQPSRGSFFIDHSSAMVSIAGIGDVHLITPTRTIAYRDGVPPRSLFVRAPSGLVLFNGPADAAVFGAWDMLSSVGPVVGTGILLQWDDPSFPPFDTDAGTLVFEFSQEVPATFQAILIPEPSTAMLLATGILALATGRMNRALAN
jgi:hypothetical protein